MFIAVIITCHNRKNKTISCLKGLYLALSSYRDDEVYLKVFLTDDGCTDGTAELVNSTFEDRDIEIVKGDGNLFWAGGMRLAWNRALEERTWDYYLLLNDDTIPHNNMFYELFNSHEYCLKKFGTIGIYSGITCDISDPNVITYGGSVWINRLFGVSKLLIPIGKPQEAHLTNANILLVPQEIVSKIGIFFHGYIHGAADYDYSIQVIKHGYKALVTGNICGTCEIDHDSREDVKNKVLQMSLSQRKEYFSHPLHSNNQYLIYYKRNVPLRYPIVLIGRYMNEYFPKLYYLIDKLRCIIYKL